MKKLSICLFALLITTAVFAQEKPFRVGLKFGVPMIAGLNAEYVLPALGGRLAPSVDVAKFSLKVGGNGISFTYLEAGANVYIKDTGRGLYGNLSYGFMGFKANVSDPDLGDGEGNLGVNLLNLKLGAKIGKMFYFRPEIGYAVPFGKNTLEVEYTDPVDGSKTRETEEIPGIANGGLLLNLGIGLSF